MDNLHSGVIVEKNDPLSSSKEAYWVEERNDYKRIVTTPAEGTEDGEISWVQARATSFRRIQRTLMQRLLRRNQEDAIMHPSGVAVERLESSRKGFLVTAQPDLDVQQELARRITLKSVTITSLSKEILFMEGAVPVKIHTKNPVSWQSLENRGSTVKEIEDRYRKAFDALSYVIGKRSEFLTASDAKTIIDLDTFRREKVRWASIDTSGRMYAQESGKMGNAWIYVIPPEHSLLAKQSALHSAHTDNAGINHVLSILPHDISGKWACLGVIHELSHLRDGVLKIEPTQGRTRDQYLEGEHKAYSIERALAFAYSDGRLGPTLQAVVANELAFRDPIQAVNSLLNERLPAIAESLDQCIESQPPKSKSELGVRLGLYCMLIGFEVARQAAYGDSTKQKSMEKGFIEMIYGQDGYLPSE